MISDFEQTLLFAVTGIILLGTLIAVVWQLLRGRNRGD